MSEVLWENPFHDKEVGFLSPSFSSFFCIEGEKTLLCVTPGISEIPLKKCKYISNLYIFMKSENRRQVLQFFPFLDPSNICLHLGPCNFLGNSKKFLSLEGEKSF